MYQIWRTRQIRHIWKDLEKCGKLEHIFQFTVIFNTFGKSFKSCFSFKKHWHVFQILTSSAKNAQICQSLRNVSKLDKNFWQIGQSLTNSSKFINFPNLTNLSNLTKLSKFKKYYKFWQRRQHFDRLVKVCKIHQNLLILSSFTNLSRFHKSVRI